MPASSPLRNRKIRSRTPPYASLVLFSLLCLVGLLIIGVTSGNSAQASPQVQPPRDSPKGALSPSAISSATSTSTIIATSSATPCTLRWRPVYSPNIGPYANSLYGIAFATANDLWAVGQYFDSSSTYLTLVEHWNGASWSVVPSPNVGSHNFLQSVAVVGPNDVWAVGQYDDGNYHYWTLAEHWDGTAWSIVPSPNPGTTDSELHGVAAVGTNDVWAVGEYRNTSNVFQTLVEHWDGTSWSIVSSPNAIFDDHLLSVTVVGTADVWAAGYYINNAQQYGTLIEHWNGVSWSIISSPNQPSSNSYLNGISARVSNDVWAVGYYEASTIIETLIEHWNGTTWSIVPSPNPSSSGNFLTSVAEGAASDVWAVGHYLDNGLQTLIEHWNGTSWAIVSGFNPTPESNSFYGVAIVGANDVWAVGYGGDPSLIERYSNQCSPPSPTQTPTVTVTGTPPAPSPTHTQAPVCEAAWHQVNSPDPNPTGRNGLNGIAAITDSNVWAVGSSTDISSTHGILIEHWDGEQWSIAPSPAIQGDSPVLSGIWAGSADDIWAVGTYAVQGVSQTLTMHWDGTQWTVVPSPDPGGGGTLSRVTGVSANDVWAIGSTILHWDGSQWSVIPYPSGGDLGDTSALSPDDVWAVGSTSLGGATQTLTMHWDGTQWTIIPSPNVGDGNNYLQAVKALSANDAWATGSRDTYSGSNDFVTLVMHWDGTAWSIVSAPEYPVIGPGGTGLNSIAAIAANDVWAVGGSVSHVGGSTVAIHWDGSAWSGSHTVNHVGEFQSLGSVTALSDGTVWAAGGFGFSDWHTLIEQYSSTDFTDVPVGSTFYSYVKCLACHGVVTGYPDGTFRPNNPVTRGQIAKIVTLSTTSLNAQTASEIPSGYHSFEDVPPGSTFFEYVEWLASQAVISGYPCGGAGEPCVPPDNLPYYRPNNTATRGQLTKIVSNTANFNDPIPPDTQTFTDVPEGSTFYTYTERLILNRPGVMSGYPCGGVGEPCDPQSRPYFRPGNTVTRGQSSKIVANTFLLSCQSADVHQTSVRK